MNRLVPVDRLAQGFARTRRHDGEVLVVVVDDRYGHDAGDQVLAAWTRSELRCGPPSGKKAPRSP